MLPILTKIKSEIDSIQTVATARCENLRADALLKFSEYMDAKRPELDKIVADLADSKELTVVENDDFFARWIRVDFKQFIDVKNEFEADLLRAYFDAEFNLEVDLRNDCLTESIGPGILINSDGDIFDQEIGKWFVSKRDYKTSIERNVLIEKHMEKTGHFPALVRCDWYGNPYFVEPQPSQSGVSK